MDNGEGSQSFGGLRKWLDGVIADPPKLRLYSHVALLVLLWFGLLSPLSDRVLKAEKALAKAQKNDRLATSMSHLVEQRDKYQPLLTGSDDILDWQNFLLSKVDAAGVRLSSIEPHAPDKRGQFSVMNFYVTVQAQQYERLADFIDRLEHSERLARVEQVLIDRTASALLMTFRMRGLAKPGLPDIPLMDLLVGSSTLVDVASSADADLADQGDMLPSDATPAEAAQPGAEPQIGSDPREPGDG